MTIPYNESGRATSENRKWKRAEIAKLVQDFESREPSVSQRDFAKEKGVARSTLRHWADRKNSIDADLSHSQMGSDQARRLSIKEVA